MFQIKYGDILYKIPVNITTSDELLRHFSSRFPYGTNEFILSFNNIFLSRHIKYNLLEIGYSPNEIIEIKDLIIKKVAFSIVGFDNKFYFKIDQYTNVFTTKQYFADFFYTVPQNIIVMHKDLNLKDADNLFDFEINDENPILITVTKEHFLVRTYLNAFHFACMPLNSTFKNLNETISIYSQKVNIYDKRTKYDNNLANFLKENGLQTDKMIDTSKLKFLSSRIPLFEFIEDDSSKCDQYTISVTVKDDELSKSFSKSYQFSYIPSVYSITVLLEKELKIERSLFIPFDEKDNQIDLNEVVHPNKPNILFRIFAKLHLKIVKSFSIDHNEQMQKYSILTSIDDFQKKWLYEYHNFGIILNNHFVCNDSIDKFLLVHFMNPNDEENAIQLELKMSHEPSRLTTYIKHEEKRKTKKHFIVSKSVNKDFIAINYLHQNLSSIEILSVVNHEVLYKNSVKMKINYFLYDKSNKKTDHSIEITGQNQRVYDFLLAIYNQKNKFSFFSLLSKNEVFEPMFKGKLYFWESLSSIPFCTHNSIALFPSEMKYEIPIMNIIDRDIKVDSFPFKSKASDIIKNYCKFKKITIPNLKLYLDFNELRPTDIPSILKPQNFFLILNKDSDEKKLKISNCNHLIFELTIKNQKYRDLASIISEIFMIPENSLAFSTTLNGENIALPSNFDAGSFQENSFIYVKYEYQKKNLITFSYDGEKKVIDVNVDDPISSHMQRIQKEFKIWNASENSIHFSFASYDLPYYRSFDYYKIPENAIITVKIKEKAFPVKISTPEFHSFSNYYFYDDDRIEDVINLFNNQYNRMFSISKNSDGTNIFDTKEKLYAKMKLYLVTKQISLKCEGSLGNEIIEVSEILRVKDVIQSLYDKLRCDFYIFTKNETKNCYEPVDEDKRFFEFANYMCIIAIQKLNSIIKF